MRKLLFIFCFLFFAITSFCNVVDSLPIKQNLGSSSTLVEVPAFGAFRAGIAFRSFTDTTQANTTFLDDYPFMTISTTSDGNLWMRNAAGTAWTLLGGGSVSPSGNFWALGGNTIYSQFIPRVWGIGALSQDSIGIMTSGVFRLKFYSTALPVMSAGTDSMLVRSIDGYVGVRAIGGSGATPTWQQTLTAGSTLTTDNTVDANTKNFEINSLKSLLLGSAGSSNINFGSGIGNSDEINLNSPTLILNGTTTKITTLSSGGSTDSVLVWNATTNIVRKRNASAFGGGSTAPGNYGNITLNRNTDFSTPASDSLGYTTSTGLSVKNNVDILGKYKVNGTQVIYLPDQTNFTASMFLGSSAPPLSHASGTEGQYNVGIGIPSMAALTTGYYNNSHGAYALNSVTTGYENNAFGVNAGRSITTGTYNLMMGHLAMFQGTDDYFNTALGSSSMYGTTHGSYFNVAVGVNPLHNADSVQKNTVVGTDGLYRLAKGAHDNTAIGYKVGEWNQMSENIFIGSRANVIPYNVGQALNIGNLIIGRNIVDVQNNGIDSNMSKGTAGIGVLNPTAAWHLRAGRDTATGAPLKFTSGTSLSTPEAGAVEYDGTNFLITNGSQRDTIATTIFARTYGGGGGGSGSPGGSNKQFQWNNAGVFGGSSMLTQETNQILLTGTSNSVIPFKIQLPASQSARIVDILDNGGTSLFAINANGQIARYGGAFASDGEIFIGRSDLGSWAKATLTAGTGISITNGTSSITIASTTLSGSATLDFGSTSAQTSADLTITVSGAADGDDVVVSPPNGSVNNNSCFTAWVSATNTVTVRFNNYSSGSIDPASGTFKVRVIK